MGVAMLPFTGSQAQEDAAEESANVEADSSVTGIAPAATEGRGGAAPVSRYLSARRFEASGCNVNGADSQANVCIARLWR